MAKVKAKAKAKLNNLPPTKKKLKTAEEIMIEQDKAGKSRAENIIGKGKKWWSSDDEFEQFLEFIDRSRHPERWPQK